MLDYKIVKYDQGYAAVLEDGSIIAGFYSDPHKASKIAYKRVCDVASMRQHFADKWAKNMENERRMRSWMQDMLQRKNVHRITAKELSHVNKEQMNALKMYNK